MTDYEYGQDSGYEVDWDAVQEWLDACWGKSLEVLELGGDVAEGFLVGVIHGDGKVGKEKLALVEGNQTLIDLGFKTGYSLKPYIEKMVWAWILGQLGIRK